MKDPETYAKSLEHLVGGVVHSISILPSGACGLVIRHWSPIAMTRGEKPRWFTVWFDADEEGNRPGYARVEEWK